jgi:hypothetical protein
MVRTPPTRRRALIGLALITIGLTELVLGLMALGDIFVSSLAATASATTIALGLALIGGMPMKTIIIALLVGGLWFWLFALPFSFLPLPLEVKFMALGFFALVPVLAVGWYERRKLAREKKEVA